MVSKSNPTATRAKKGIYTQTDTQINLTIISDRFSIKNINKMTHDAKIKGKRIINTQELQHHNTGRGLWRVYEKAPEHRKTSPIWRQQKAPTCKKPDDKNRCHTGPEDQ